LQELTRISARTPKGLLALLEATTLSSPRTLRTSISEGDADAFASLLRYLTQSEITRDLEIDFGFGRSKELGEAHLALAKSLHCVESFCIVFIAGGLQRAGWVLPWLGCLPALSSVVFRPLANQSGDAESVERARSILTQPGLEVRVEPVM
jgi:hypothetical protein